MTPTRGDKRQEESPDVSLIRRQFRKFSRMFKGEGLRALALRGAVWSFAGFGLQNLLRLLSNLILTRLLVPEMFGLMALANVFITGLTLLSDVGTTTSVVRSDRGDDKPFLRTIWTVQVIRGFLIGGLACAVAWPMSKLYEEPILFPLLCFMSLSAVFKGFQSVSLAIQSRKMNVFQLMRVGVLSQVVTIVVTVALALWLESVWALAIGAVVGAAWNVILSHILLPKFPHRFRLERRALGEIIRFGRWILLGTICTYMGGQGAQALQGLLVPLDVLGFIAIATLLGRLPGQLLQKILGSVVFPAFSKTRREDPDRLPGLLLRMRLVILGVTVPLFFGLAYFAQPIVDLLYDPRYAAAGFIMALLLAEDVIASISAPYQNLMLAEGDSHLHALVMAFWAGARAVGIFAGFAVAGVFGMLVGMAIGSTLMFILSAGLAWRRAYATKVLDVGTLVLCGAFYAYIALALDIPAALVF